MMMDKILIQILIILIILITTNDQVKMCHICSSKATSIHLCKYHKSITVKRVQIY